LRGNGGREREVPVPEAVQQALESWMKVHPLARSVALQDEEPSFVRLGRHAHEDPVALSAEAVYRVVSRHASVAGIPARLAHPHALRAYWATHCLEAGVPSKLVVV
jgi:integrase